MIISKLKNIKGGRRDFRKFGLTLGVILVAIGAYLWWREKAFAFHFIYGGIIISILGLIIPKSLKYVYKGWMLIGEFLGSIVTFFISSIAFYFIVTPMAFVARLMGKKFIRLRPDKQLPSYWQAKNNAESEKSWGKQF